MNDDPHVLRIPPGTKFDMDARQVQSAEEKRQRAIAWLGERWLLYNRRGPRVPDSTDV